MKTRINRFAASLSSFLFAAVAAAGGCATPVAPETEDAEAVGSAEQAADWHCAYDCWASENVACHNAAGAILSACCAANNNNCTPCAAPYWAAMAACDAAIPACVAACDSASCADGVQNQGETGVDCGGPCPACASCADGVQNQGETGVDCGSPCPACTTCNSYENFEPAAPGPCVAPLEAHCAQYCASQGNGCHEQDWLGLSSPNGDGTCFLVDDCDCTH